MESSSMYPTAADWASSATHSANDAAKEAAKIALKAHDRIDKLEKLVATLTKRVDLVVDWNGEGL